MGLGHPWVEEHPDYFVPGTELDLARAPQNYTWVNRKGGYLLLALAFAHVDLVMEALSPGPFALNGGPLPAGFDGRKHFLLVYFSLTTQTSVGYGDLLPFRQAAGPSPRCRGSWASSTWPC